MTTDLDEFDFLELPAGGIDVEVLDDDPFGYAPVTKKQSTVLAPVLIPVTDAIIHELGERVFPVRINGVGDTTGLARAKELAKQCADLRNLIENSREKIKKPYLDMGRKIDAEAKRLQALLEPAESFVKAQIGTVEKSLKKIEQERLDRLYEKRRNELEAINVYLPEASVRAMNDEEFANLIERSLKEFEEQAEEANRRIAQQKEIDAERAKQKAESDRLAAERAEMQRKQDEQTAELARQRQELAEQQRQIDQQKAAAAQAEQDRLDAIEAEKRRAAAVIRAEQMRPYSVRLDDFSKRLLDITKEAPAVNEEIDEEVSSIVIDAAIDIHNIAERLVALEPTPAAAPADEFADI